MGLLNKAFSFFRKNKVSVEKKQTIDVNIGLDFGTSYSKVCFAERNTFDFVKYDIDEYKPSIVYYDIEKAFLHYIKPSNSNYIEEIKYFKYSMIDENLSKSDNMGILKLNIKPEILCSIFFLACLIKESKEYAFNFFQKKQGDIHINWYITMGVPIDNYENKYLQLYDRLLILAEKLSLGLTEKQISISDLNSYYLNNQNIQIPKFQTSNLNTLPELYAESLAFLQNRNTMTGVYLLIDIGGGTVDMAVMLKEVSNEFSIVSKTIQPFGIDIIINNIVTDRKMIEQVKSHMKNKKNLAGIPYVSEENEKKYKEMFQRVYATIIAGDLKQNGVWKNGIEQSLKDRNGIIEIYICGGGANHKWYEDGIEQKERDLRKLLVDGLKLEIKPIGNLLPNNKINHRLLIAYILALPVEKIPPLAGFPWHFQADKNISKDDYVNTRYNIGQDIQKERYGTPV